MTSRLFRYPQAPYFIGSYTTQRKKDMRGSAYPSFLFVITKGDGRKFHDQTKGFCLYLTYILNIPSNFIRRKLFVHRFTKMSRIKRLLVKFTILDS
ncbi:hypothetical protein SAMN05421787_107142 [Virgibacillus pantothenticus]|nr:hypothetical protein SAMN05421787_107142 [Virgibacillus pantothenticus]